MRLHWKGTYKLGDLLYKIAMFETTKLLGDNIYK